MKNEGDVNENNNVAIDAEETKVDGTINDKNEKYVNNTNNDDDDDDDKLGELSEWIKAWSARDGGEWYFYNQFSGVKRKLVNGPDYYKKAQRLSYQRMDKRFSATYRIQMFIRAALARRKVRRKRGLVWSTDLMVPGTRWAELLDLNYELILRKKNLSPKSKSSEQGNIIKKQKYFYNLDTNEIRWEAPASVLFNELVQPHIITCDSMKIRYDAIKAVSLYEKDERAQESLRLCNQRIMSAISKGKIIAKRVTTVMHDRFDDVEEFTASVELLELATSRAEEQLAKLEICIETAQGFVLEFFSNRMDDLEELVNKRSTQYWPEHMLISSKAMLEEVTRAVNATLDWWAEISETISDDILTYLHPNLIHESPNIGNKDGSNVSSSKVPLISREDYIPVHPTVEEVGKRVLLLEELIEDGIEKGRQNKESIDQERELSHMRANEAEMRVLLRRERVEALKREKELKFIAQCRNSWQKGLTLKEMDQKAESEFKDMVRFGAAQHGSKKKEENPEEQKKRHVKRYEEMLELKRLNQYPDPWSGLEGGCTIEVFKQLIADEVERRKNQENRLFHVDDPDHETKKRLLHSACFWGRYTAMELLVQLGANVNLVDGILTKFTPLDETARGGQARLAMYLLDNGAVQSLYIQNIHGETPIHTAARRDFWLYLDTVFKYLKQNGLERILKRILVTINNKGQTPRDVAKCVPVQELLYDTELEYGLLSIDDKKKRRNLKKNI
jgi:hypothetical protein